MKMEWSDAYKAFGYRTIYQRKETQVNQQYDNTNSGALFKNDKKETANHPDYKGQINVDGVEYWLSAWIKPKKQDPAQKYMSLSVQPKEAQQPKQAPRQRPRDEDDIPF